MALLILYEMSGGPIMHGLTVSENMMRDLGVVVDSHLCFSEHIANIVRKAHQRANLIHRCFTSKNSDLLVKAFKVYVRPILEFNSPVWSPSLSKDILLIESVQRKFTKRIPSMSGLTYYSRLQVLGLKSLEIRRTCCCCTELCLAWCASIVMIEFLP